MTKKIIFTANAPKAIGPYSQAISGGGFTFVSGQVAINPETGDSVSYTHLTLPTIPLV